MKIAILTSGILPVPSVQGGAVENLIDFYLDYNNHYKLHEITVYSVYHPLVKKHPALISDVNHYYHIKTEGLLSRIKRKIYYHTHHKNYYNHFIEFFFEKAYNLIKKQDYDYILLENRPGYAHKLSQRGYRNIILHLHNDLLNNCTQYHQEIFDNLKLILTVSDYIRNRVSSIKEDQKIQTIHNGINLQQFSIQNKSLINRADIGFNQNDCVLIYSGRINKDKGISELIDAMLLLEKHTNIKLLIIGSTFFGNENKDNPFVSSLKERCYKIKERIIFTGFISYDKMPLYLQLANIAVIPSIWNDPFPTTVLEAQAMGLPIISTKRGGIPEEVSMENAILLEVDDNLVNNLAQTILHLSQNPEKRNAMAKASIEHSKRFDKGTFSRNFFNAIENLN